MLHASKSGLPTIFCPRIHSGEFFLANANACVVV